jgi:hypothetical protein
MRSKGYSFGVSRIFEEVCRVDSAGPQTVANAWAAGFAHMDVRNTHSQRTADATTSANLSSCQQFHGAVLLFFLPACLSA